MKRMMTAAIVMVVLSGSILLVPARAQDDTSAGQTTTRQMPSPDQVVDTLGSKLNLTDDQKAQIKPIITDRQQQLMALKGDTSMRPMQKRRKMKSIFEDSDKKIKAILNDQQKQQYEQIEQQMREQMKERMKNRGAGGSGSPE